MRILTLAPYYLPGFRAGGPIRSLANLVDRLGDGYDFRIVTSDRDLGDERPYEVAGSSPWNSVGKGSVGYLPARTPWRLRNACHDVAPGLIYINGLFNTHFGMTPLLMRRAGLMPAAPCLVAPRGELGVGALSIKRRKKTATLTMAKRLGLFRGLRWHATSPEEVEDIRRIVGPKAKVYLAPNLTSFVSESAPARPAKRPGQLRLAYFSRVTPKKNLHWGLARLAEEGGPAEIDIWGPIEEGEYWTRCRAEIDRCPPGVRVSVRGPLAPDRVVSTLARYDAMLLPTLGENFGHAIIESLTAGCPPLISDRTPWRGLYEAGVGWDLSLEDPAAFRRAIGDLRAMDETHHATMRRAALAHARNNTAGVETLSRELFAAAAA